MERQYATMQYIIACILYLLPSTSTLLPRLRQQTDGSTYQSPCGDARCRWQLCRPDHIITGDCQLGPTNDMPRNRSNLLHMKCSTCVWIDTIHATCILVDGHPIADNNYDDDRCRSYIDARIMTSNRHIAFVALIVVQPIIWQVAEATSNALTIHHECLKSRLINNYVEHNCGCVTYSCSNGRSC
jgi:hypothetical protein